MFNLKTKKSMIKTGFIKAILPHREFISRKDGSLMRCYPLVLTLPYNRNDGQEGYDEVICDCISGNEGWMDSLRDWQNLKRKCEFTLFFRIEEYQGRQYQRCKLFDVKSLA